VSYQNCHFEVESDKVYNVVFQNIKSKSIGILQILKKNLVPVTYNQINCLESIKLSHTYIQVLQSHVANL